MFRIGILGSDNSHADRFSEILNRRSIYWGPSG